MIFFNSRVVTITDNMVILAFVFYYQGILRLGAAKVGLFINLVPVSGVVLSSLFLKEKIVHSLLLGFVFVCFGIYLTNSRNIEKTISI